MFETASELFRGIVVTSNKTTGEVLVNVPSVLGKDGTVPVEIINKARYDGLYEVPDPGTQVVIGSENSELSHPFLLQADPGTVRKSPNWDGVLLNGVISQRGTQGWVIDGLGNSEFHGGYFRGELEIGTTVGGQPIPTNQDVTGLQQAAADAQAAANAAQAAADAAAATAGAGSAEAQAAQQAADQAQAAANNAAAAAAAAVQPADLYNPGSTNISGARIKTGRIESGNFQWDGASTFSTRGTRIDLDTGSIISPGLRVIADTSPTTAVFSGSVVLGLAPNQLTITANDGMDLPLGEDGVSKISWRSDGGTEVSYLRSRYSASDNSSITELLSRSLGGGLVTAEVGNTPTFTAGNRLDITADGDNGVLQLIGGGGWSRIVLGPKGKMSDGTPVPAAAYWENLGDIWLAPYGSGGRGHVVIRRYLTTGAQQLWLGPWVTNNSYMGMFNGLGATGNYIIMSDITHTYVSTPASAGNVYLRPGLNSTTSEIVVDHTGTITLGAGRLAVRNGTILQGDLDVGGAGAIGRMYGGVGRIMFNDIRYYALNDANHRTYYDTWYSAPGHGGGPTTAGWNGVGMYATRPDTRLYIQGDGNVVQMIAGVVRWATGQTTSSRSVKRDIEPFSTTALPKIRQMRPKTFKWNYDDPRPEARRKLEDFKKRPDRDPDEEARLQDAVTLAEEQWTTMFNPAVQSPALGFIAEELAQIEPLLTVQSAGIPMGIDYDRVVALLVLAIQELDARIPGGRP